MKKKLTVLTLAAFSFSSILYTSCIKKDPCDDVVCQNGGVCGASLCSCPSGYAGTKCEIASAGTIRFMNRSANPYQLYINGESKGSLAAGQSTSFYVPFDYYFCRVVQESGYTAGPIDKTYEGVVTATNNLTVSFP